MADIDALQHFRIEDLATKKITLYPAGAQVVRSLDKLKLKPGINEIEITGIAPSAQEQSLRAEVSSNVHIIDTTVDFIPNPEKHPSFDEFGTGFVHPFSEDDEAALPTEITELRDRAVRLGEEKLSADEEIASIVSQYDMLTGYCRSLNANNASNISTFSDTINLYDHERAVLADRLAQARDRSRKASDEVGSLTKKADRLQAEYYHEKREKELEERRKHAQENREAEDKARRAREEKEEKLAFWPASVYRVIVTIEVPIDTPSTSRRSSISSQTATLTDKTMDKFPEAVSKSDGSNLTEASLSLIYLTTKAFWTPRYDISISTLNNTGLLTYRAELINRTSETWKDAEVFLSTSQASFQGLSDEIPRLEPWHVQLSKQDIPLSPLSPSETHVARGHQLQSQLKQQFQMQQQQLYGAAKKSAHFDRARFGNNSINVESVTRVPHAQSNVGGLFGGSNVANTRPGEMVAFNNSNNVEFRSRAPQAQSNVGVGLFGGSNVANTRPGETVAFNTTMPLPPPAPTMYMRRSAPDGPPLRREDEVSSEETYESDSEPEDSFEDHGMTMTYCLPRTRTLTPSDKARRHRITSMDLKSLTILRTAIPKLRKAAFLRAKFTNPSASITLLRAPAGLTLDGVFLGATTLPRTSPGSDALLPLGVDPAVPIAYATPTVKRSETGNLFTSRSTAQMFVRRATVTNTKNVPIDLTVLDQIPIPDDDGIKVVIVKPAGLALDSDRVKAGRNAREGARKETEDWGRAVCRASNTGEIKWEVKLNKGCACVLELEYELRSPQGQGIVSKTG